MAVNVEMDESFAYRKIEKWPDYLQTVDKPWNSPGETFLYTRWAIISGPPKFFVYNCHCKQQNCMKFQLEVY